MATSKMEVAMKVVQMGLSSRLERLQLLARAISNTGRSEGIIDEVCHWIMTDEDLLDFVLLWSPTRKILIRWERNSGSQEPLVSSGGHSPTGGLCGRCRIQGDPFQNQNLKSFVSEATGKTEVRSGLLVLDSQTMKGLGYKDPPEEGLFIAAVSPFSEGAFMLVGAMLNGRDDLVSVPVELLWPRDREYFAATLFLKDRRVATTLREGGLGSQVDPRVVKKVLEEGTGYTGSATVLGNTFYTAYMPLRDYRGIPVGIIGIGAKEEVYEDMRARTVTHFTALIILGVGFGFLMTYFFSALLIRPIAELAKGMNRVARGDLNYKVRIASADELGRLADAFNIMVKTIKTRDMELREMTEERLSQVEKQVSIGRLAAGVAHEINNPLTSVLGLSMMMQKNLKPDDPYQEDLEIIVEETTRCKKIVSNLLDFARERPSEKRITDVNQVIRESLILTSKYEKMDQVNVDLKLADEPLLVHADAKQLQQVFTNVVTNAAEAMTENGTITITSDEDSSGGFVVVQVRDTGMGIPREHLDRVFEPFFTTKGAVKGTGLGLSVSLGMIRKHNGTIEMDSKEGKGTTVTIILPRETEEGQNDAR